MHMKTDDELARVAEDVVLQRLHDAINHAVGRRIEIEHALRERDLLIAVMEHLCPAEISIARETIQRMQVKR